VSLSILSEARPLNAKECVALGLAEGVEETLERVVQRFVEPRLQGGVDALRALKRQVQAHRTLPSTEALGQEADVFAEVWGGPAHRKALADRGLG
jgi:enoyl-CoA hydratase/carnithine racemase